MVYNLPLYVQWSRMRQKQILIVIRVEVTIGMQRLASFLIPLLAKVFIDLFDNLSYIISHRRSCSSGKYLGSRFEMQISL